MRINTAPLLALALLALSGCASIGPGSVNRDRFDYNVALTDAWKSQILLNVVKLRYVEPVSFVDVGQIVSAYSLESGVSLGGSRAMYDLPSTKNNFTVNTNLSGKYTDSPTITYTPLTGKAFLKTVVMPIPVQNIMRNLQAGVAADITFTMSVSSINGLRNEDMTAAGLRPADERFLRVAKLLRSLQLAGMLRINMQDKSGGMTLGFPRRVLPPEIRAQAAELRTLLDLAPDRDSYRVVGGHGDDDVEEIAISGFSIMQILRSMSLRVDVPDEDIKAGWATPDLPEDPGQVNPLGARIHSGEEEPGHAFTSVRFRDRWFWVADSDLNTKRLFSFLLMAFTLTDDSRPNSHLQLTVPTK